VKRLPLRIRRFFIKAQIGLASAVLLGILIDALILSAKSLEDVLITWLILAFLLLAAQLLLLSPRVQRYSYYHIWTGALLGLVLRITGGVEGLSRDLVHPARPRLGWLLTWFDLRYENWIRDSARWEPSGATKAGFVISPHPPGTPVLVQRDHLTGRYRWPGQSFATAVLFTPVRITRSKSTGYRLSVDLTGEPYGIYKNRGKQFLDYLLRELQQEVPPAEMRERSALLHRFLMGAACEPAEITAGGPYQPLRWSSAGALPLVRWRKPGQSSADDWFVLFYRGINPVGWNLANGSSESAREWRHLFEVGVRELCEELVVLEGPPVRNGKPVAEVYRRRFLPGAVAAAYPDLARRLTGRDFVREHDRLRAVQDQMTITDDAAGAGLRLHEVETNATVVVKDDSQSYSTANVIFTVNPLEAGIESTFVFRFDLGDDDYLLFGEVLEDIGALAREPVMLLRRSFVESQLSRHGSLGELLPGQERKQLPGIPAGDYHIFDADTVLRERRLRALLNDADIPAGDIRDVGHVTRLRDERIARRLASETDRARGRALLEARFHANWLAEYGSHFSTLNPGGDLEACAPDENPLLVLCAVTWKTLELVCQHKIGA
jgi:hypothetical protein